MLHVAEVSSPRTACADAPVHLADVVTSGETGSGKGELYYIYVLGTPRVPDDPPGILAFRFGVDYEKSPEPDQGLKIFSWLSCAESELRYPGWPEPGTGNTLLWSEETCQQTEVVVGGYFYVSAYSPSIMSLAAFPATGVVEFANCQREIGEFIPVSMNQVGWVSLGGAAKAGDTDGCNPAVEPCNQEPTPVQPTTWGRIKAKYGD